MAADVPLFVAPTDSPRRCLILYRALPVLTAEMEWQPISTPKTDWLIAGSRGQIKLGVGKNKKVELSLLVHPQWLAGSPRQDENNHAYGGSPRMTRPRPRAGAGVPPRFCLLRFVGTLPEEVTCPETKVIFSRKWHGSKKSTHVCAACGTGRMY